MAFACGSPVVLSGVLSGCLCFSGGFCVFLMVVLHIFSKRLVCHTRFDRVLHYFRMDFMVISHDFASGLHFHGCESGFFYIGVD